MPLIVSNAPPIVITVDDDKEDKENAIGDGILAFSTLPQ
jgi:hypothetical protein